MNPLQNRVASECLLRMLGWKEVERLSKSRTCGSVIRAHIKECSACKEARGRDIEERLALMSPDRRAWFEYLGRKAAEIIAANC